MFEALFKRPSTIARYRSAPQYEDRVRYLTNLAASGAARCTLRLVANDQLELVCLPDLWEGEMVTQSLLSATVDAWSGCGGSSGGERRRPEACRRLLGHACRWLRFLGRIAESVEAPHPYAAELEAYVTWMRDVRGLAEGTIRGRFQVVAEFLRWLSERDVPLSEVRINDIDEALSAKMTCGTYLRVTVHNHARYLRTFLRFAEARGLCRPGLADGVLPPRRYQGDAIPQRLSREDVLRLLATTEGERPTDKRDRAILMLLIGYGLRASEVCSLELEDLDWEEETLRVRRSKSGRTEIYPLSRGIGEAILRYLLDVRPARPERALFLTSRAPIRPLRGSALSEIAGRRLDRLGLPVKRRGAHVLRHAAAQHLLDQGLSMKAVGDYLGHRRISSTSAYARVHLEALREVVADFDLGGLA